MIIRDVLALTLLSAMLSMFLNGQASLGASQHEEQIISLIDQYGRARESRDLALLRSILTKDVDQLVSSGEWRRGIDQALEGMMQSSTRRPGSRVLTVESIRSLGPEHAIANARYEIQNSDGSVRKMWSTFVVTLKVDKWKIAAIRNMLPAR